MKQDRPKLEYEKRSARGKWAVRRLRAQGIVPAIVYGHEQPPEPIQVSRHDIDAIVRHGERVVDLTANGQTETTIIREVQWDPLGVEILHVDFERVRVGERIEVEVPIQLRGTAPGVEQGGKLNQVLHHLEVECPATDIPEFIRVDIRSLQAGDAIHVRDLELPDGVKVLTEPDLVVVAVELPVEEEEVAEEEAAAAPAEPELVGRKGAEEEKEKEQK